MTKLSESVQFVLSLFHSCIDPSDYTFLGGNHIHPILSYLLKKKKRTRETNGQIWVPRTLARYRRELEIVLKIKPT